MKARLVEVVTTLGSREDAESLGRVLVEERLAGASIVHLMDREADCYELLAALVENDRRFVVRMSKNRRALSLDGATAGQLRELLGDATDLLEREVSLSRRRKKTAPRAAKRHGGPELAATALARAATHAALPARSRRRHVVRGRGAQDHRRRAAGDGAPCIAR